MKRLALALIILAALAYGAACIVRNVAQHMSRHAVAVNVECDQ